MSDGKAAESPYYQDSGVLPLASRLSLHVRRNMFRLFMDAMTPGAATRVLDVGVTNDQTFRESNYFERMYPYPHNITCVGTEDGSYLEREFPGLRYLQVRPHEALPYRDGEFDIVFSNAVIEHVGSRSDQAAFAREICRVGERFFVTTPNRWFPFEHHTGLPLLHFLPAAHFRALLRNTRYQYWSHEEHLNILTARELRQLFPASATTEVRTVRVAGVPANLVAFGRSAGA